jgi:dTDP-4-amino-4,6-dideoxygalactose transaminase
MWRVQLFKLNFDEREAQAAFDVVRGGWLTMGERTVEFERAFAAFLGDGARAVAVSSGTAALHMAMLALGIGEGDEVITSALTFIADANVVRVAGATPVLADCRSYQDWNIDPASVESRITPRTRAVLAVHYAGFPCAMDALGDLCRRHGLHLVEDAAHAPGARYRGRSCGTFGAFGCFSFFSNKNLSVGEGGMLVTGAEDLEQKARYLRSHGMTTLTLDRHQGRAVTYDVAQPGLNYRIDEIRAAIGCVQLEKLPAANKRRGELWQEYCRRLEEIAELIVPFSHADGEPSCHIMPILLAPVVNRGAVIERLKAQGIQSSIHYPAIGSFSAYRGIRGETPLADDISRRELTLPFYPTMTEDDVALVCACLKEALAC